MKKIIATTLLSLVLSTSAHAHMRWLLPSHTVLSEPAYVTFDSSISNNLFFPERPFPVDGLMITKPDGTPGSAENLAKGKLRNSFDLNIDQEGTWRVGLQSSFFFIRYQDKNGERGGWRGDRSGLEAALKEAREKAADDVTVMESHSRMETFVTLGQPTRKALVVSGEGIEMQSNTHPNDLYNGETTQFTFTIDGKPQQGVEVHITRGGTRYRNDTATLTLETDKKGRVSVPWSEPGRYLLEVSAEGKSREKGVARRLGYLLTLEVLPQ